MSFSPIAIVGRSCVLPSALSPQELWNLVLRKGVATSRTPVGRWGIRPELMLAKANEPTADRAISDVGGYVEGFAFDSHGFHLPADFLDALDPVFQWLLHTGREALRESKWKGSCDRVGAIVGNLSYPSAALSRFAERVWLEGQTVSRKRGQPAVSLASLLGVAHVDPHNRFMSGLPAHFMAQSLGLGQGAFALDAACASSLYALKFACDALADGRADLMLAGAVNRADDLFIHAGFTALSALSPTGRTRPFHAEADGLVPAEGAAMLALMRLSDAQASGAPIFGVIRGIGLSNDGRGRGLLVPSQAGQVRALLAAYDNAQIDPARVGYVECHATGTTVGDAVEVATLAEVFGRRSDGLAVGSLKANLGHLITAAGAAGIIKVLSAFSERTMPPTPSLDRPASSLAEADLRALGEPQPWPDQEQPRLAAVSAFGFGGNNAHVILQEPPRVGAPVSVSVLAPVRSRQPVAIVGLGMRVADGTNVSDFAEALFTGTSRIVNGIAAAHEVTVSLAGLRFPPKDLEETLPQQLMVFAAAREAVHQVADLPSERTAVFVGMQCDAEIARHGARWRAAQWAEQLNAPPAWLNEARTSFVPLLGAAGVLGAMPNIPANRLSSQLNLEGPSFTVSSEELSGIRALALAERALQCNEIDAAIVGAVDLCAEPVHRASAKVLSASRQVGGDAAVVLVLKRLDDAQAAGDVVLAIVQTDPAAPFAYDDEPRATGDALLPLGDGAGAVALDSLFGHAHAASGLLHVAAAALCCAYGQKPGTATNKDWTQKDGDWTAEVFTTALGDQAARVVVRGQNQAPPVESVLAELRADAYRPAPPLLTFPAHRGTPRLPPLAAATPTAATPTAATPTAAQPTKQASVSLMPLPPQLPRAGDLVLLAPTEEPLREAASPPLSLSAPHALAYRNHLALMHHGYLDEAAKGHAQFLALRDKSFALLLRGPLSTFPVAPTPAPKPAQVLKPTQVLDSTVATGSQPVGPQFSRSQLLVHASGKISTLFGASFAVQDGHALQVRMPEPPLLLADRVVGLQAVPGSMGLGTVWTQTDVLADSWYLNRGYMPAGIMIEAGQADLFLISYLGIDALNKGERAYRLLGCELTYHGGLPKPGETLQYKIAVDAHARQGDVRLFFFHYDCTVGNRAALTVRQGQAGFFSKDELDNSAGVLWKPEDQEICPAPRLDPPLVPCQSKSFSQAQVKAFASGNTFACFGPGFELAQTHTRSPAIAEGNMLLVDHVADFDPQGGPWGRGYLKAVTPISPNDWFFKGHFKNDPCMPGTLMFEGCLQAMAIYLAALGFTLHRDGWSFGPVPDESFKLQCRGQVLPSSKELVCELFVEEVHDGPMPTLYADLLGTVDGLKAFHARRVGLRLSPDWPLSSMHKLPDQAPAPSSVIGGKAFDYASLLACAWGRPSDAFGPMYRVFDGTRRVARLPGPPYHFMSRVTRIDGDIGICKPGATIEIQYDVPPHAWYFDQNGARTMPYCVLLEAVLQPCGWLASFVGSALLSEEDLSFRNLDGNGRVFAEVLPSAGTLRTITTIKSVSRSGGMILQTFDVQCFVGDTLIYKLDTGFGFFPKAALSNQVGLPTSAEQRSQLEASSSFFVDLTQRPATYFDGSLRLAEPMLLMIDRVTAYDPQGGMTGLGFARAEKTVDTAEWFFKAHFFQDPVQPGSLGIEAMLQLLQFTMLYDGLGQSMKQPRFLPLALGHDMTWKYRGQVVPANKVVTTTLHITRRERDAQGNPLVFAEASLWVDGKRIYQANDVGMTIVDEGMVPTPMPMPRGFIPAADTFISEQPADFLPRTRAFWQSHLGFLPPAVDDVLSALLTRFVGSVHLSTSLPDLSQAPRGVLFLGNHQTSIESTLFAIIASALVGTPLLTLARSENSTYWLELLMQHIFSFPGFVRPVMAKLFDRSDSASLPGIIAEMAQEMVQTRRSMMVHVEGTRALACRQPVQTLSGTFIDMAVNVGCPIVPVRFAGGLPATALPERTEFPVGMGKQDIYIGQAIAPETLRSLHYGARKQLVLDAMNALGPPLQQELPQPPDPLWQAEVVALAKSNGTNVGHAVFLRLLQGLSTPCEALLPLVNAPTGTIVLPQSPEGRWVAELARRLWGPQGPRLQLV